MASQIISKERVTDFGEVLTGTREVNEMLDLVKHETERIESRFLEPACGNGNFLAEILERKLRVVGARYARSQLNDAVYKFKRYEDASLSYAGISRHADKDVGLYDTVISAREFAPILLNES